MVSAEKWLAIICAPIFALWIAWLAHIAMGWTGVLFFAVIVMLAGWLGLKKNERLAESFLPKFMLLLVGGVGLWLAFTMTGLFGPLVGIGVFLLLILFWKMDFGS